MKFYIVVLDIGFERISTLTVTKEAYSWEELELLEALWEKFANMHCLHCTGDSAVVH